MILSELYLFLMKQRTKVQRYLSSEFNRTMFFPFTQFVQFSLDIIATFLQLFTPFKILLSRLISQGRVMHNSTNRSPYRNFPANGFL